MADLTDKQAALTTKVVGVDPVTGIENFYATVDTGANLNVSDVLNQTGQYRAQSITTTASEALGGTTILSDRRLLTILPTNGTVYWGFNSSVTTTTGTPLFKNQFIALAVSDDIHIYLIGAATVDCRISEAK